MKSLHEIEGVFLITEEVTTMFGGRIGEKPEYVNIVKMSVDDCECEGEDEKELVIQFQQFGKEDYQVVELTGEDEDDLAKQFHQIFKAIDNKN